MIRNDPHSRVLLAEDEPLSRVRLKGHLEGWGYDVLVAADGTSAWAQLEADDAPQLAIIDWLMPGLDGVEICRRLRQRGREPYVYVILLTGRDRREHVIEGFAAGADDYVTKPFDEHELEARIRTGQRITTLQRELVQAREALRYQATHDPLTGAFNRAAGREALGRELARARRDGSSVAALILDLDHFKSVNDRHGHAGGDSVLCEVVARVAAQLRPYDMLVRHGGEEFLAILPRCDVAQAARIAERLRHAIADSTIALPAGGSTTVTASFGVATSSGGEDDDVLLAIADEALFRAKRAGRNRVSVAPDPALPSTMSPPGPPAPSVLFPRPTNVEVR